MTKIIEYQRHERRIKTRHSQERASTLLLALAGVAALGAATARAGALLGPADGHGLLKDVGYTNLHLGRGLHVGRSSNLLRQLRSFFLLHRLKVYRLVTIAVTDIGLQTNKDCRNPGQVVAYLRSPLFKSKKQSINKA